jgi:two-component sensor histidine kinase
MKLSPTSEYEDYFEKSRYQITFRISVVLALILLVLGISFIVLDQPASTVTFSGVLICIGLGVHVAYTKKYKVGAFLFATIGTFLCVFTLITFTNVFHFVDPLWMIIISLFTYFTLGKLWGNITVLIQFAAVVYYLLFLLNENLSRIPKLSDGELYSISFNAALCGLVIAALTQQFLKRNKYAEEQYRTLTHELQSKNDLVEKQNNEKTAMLKEIHHRVKNNLQVITSLLRLQSRDLESEEAQLHFKEAIDRIGAMALIHNQMYQSTDIGRIELEHYLRTLSKNMMTSYLLDKDVKMKFQIEIEYAPSSMMVPIALLFNELVSNSVKHAFKIQENPEISIKIINHETNSIQFIYKDNGHWIQPAKDDSFGLELIDTLAIQLNGSVSRKIENGTSYEIIFHQEEDLTF